MDSPDHDYKETHPSVGWIAGIAAIAVAVIFVFLASADSISSELILWADAAMIAAAAIGLVAWIAASFTR